MYKSISLPFLLLGVCSCGGGGSSGPPPLQVTLGAPGIIQGNDNSVSWTLTGTGFESGAMVTSPLAGVTISAVNVVSAAQITFTLTADNTTPVGTTTIMVTNPDMTMASFTVATVPATVLLSAHVQPILTARCTGCHGGGTPSAGLDLTASHGTTVNVASTQVPAMMLIAPGDPDASYLVDKVQGTHTVGGLMPLGGMPLSITDRALLRKWIEPGALNN